jgi:cellulose 1,4-beta-cellobiosidase
VSQVTLNWNATAGATSYNVKRSATSGGPYANIATSVVSPAYTDTLSGGTYYYVVSAVNAAGESSNSAQASATVTLAAPGGLTAAAGNASVLLGRSAAPGATSYNVKRGTVSGGTYSTIAPAHVGTGYTDSGLTNGATYYYVVSAVYAGGESANTSQVNATPMLPPVPVVELSSASIAVASGTVGISLAISDTGRTYQLQRSDTLAPNSWVNLGAAQAGGGVLSFSDNSGAPSGQAFYRILIQP